MSHQPSLKSTHSDKLQQHLQIFDWNSCRFNQNEIDFMQIFDFSFYFSSVLFLFSHISTHTFHVSLHI